MPGPKLPGWGGRDSAPAQREEGQENSLAIRTKMMLKSSEWHQILKYFGSVYAQLWGFCWLRVIQSSKKWL